jgi:hypothetical protein
MLHDRVELLLEEIMYCDMRNSVGLDKARTYLRRALKEQDKITRHACSELIIFMDEVCETPTGGSAIDKDHAASIVLNADSKYY